MEEIYIKVNDEYIQIKKEDIIEILDPILETILKRKHSKIEDELNYSYIGNKIKQRCNKLGFCLYNKNKKIRNINGYLHKEYSGLKNYITRLN